MKIDSGVTGRSGKHNSASEAFRKGMGLEPGASAYIRRSDLIARVSFNQ